MKKIEVRCKCISIIRILSVMDVICPRHAPIYGVRGDMFLLDIDSEAFAIGNELVVLYGPTNRDESWLGSYRVITKTTFAADSLTDMLSRMIFGQPRKVGIERLHEFLGPDTTLTNVRCCFVCARSVKQEALLWPWPSKLRHTPHLPDKSIDAD